MKRISRINMRRLLDDVVLLEHADPGARKANTVTNTYVLLNEDGQALFIDASFDYLLPPLRALLREGYQAVSLALTHRHLLDHPDEAAHRIATAFDIPILLHPDDVAGRKSSTTEVTFVNPLKNSTLDHFGLETIFFPGHTEGHVMYYRERDNLLFMGDTALGPTRRGIANGLQQLIRPPIDSNTDDEQLRRCWLAFSRPVQHALPLHGATFTWQTPAQMVRIMQPLQREHPTEQMEASQ